MRPSGAISPHGLFRKGGVLSPAHHSGKFPDKETPFYQILIRRDRRQRICRMTISLTNASASVRRPLRCPLTGLKQRWIS